MARLKRRAAPAETAERTWGDLWRAVRSDPEVIEAWRPIRARLAALGEVPLMADSDDPDDPRLVGDPRIYLRHKAELADLWPAFRRAWERVARRIRAEWGDAWPPRKHEQSKLVRKEV